MPGRTRAHAWVVVAAGTALVSASCGLFGGSDDAGPARSTTTSAPGSTTTTTTAPAGPELVDTGAEPRSPLRYALEPGTTTVATLTTDLELAQADATRPHTVDPPPVVQTLRIEVGEVDERGAAFTVEVTDVSVAASGTELTDEEAAALDEELEPLVGAHGSGLLTALGQLEDVAYEVPDGAPASVRAQVDDLPRQLEALLPPLPSEPVGVGASWTVTADISIGGVRSHQVTTYELTARDGTSAAYRARIRTTAPRQELPEAQIAGMPDGTTAELVTATYEGTGRGTLRLDLPMSPAQAAMEGTQTVVVASEGGKERRFEQVVRVATRVRLP